MQRPKADDVTGVDRWKFFRRYDLHKETWFLQFVEMELIKKYSDI